MINAHQELKLSTRITKYILEFETEPKKSVRTLNELLKKIILKSGTKMMKLIKVMLCCYDTRSVTFVYLLRSRDTKEAEFMI